MRVPALDILSAGGNEVSGCIDLEIALAGEQLLTTGAAQYKEPPAFYGRVKRVIGCLQRTLGKLLNSLGAGRSADSGGTGEA